jgi:hypothetical protein
MRCTTPEFQIAESNLLELQFDTPQEFIEKYGPKTNSKIYEDFLQVFGLMEGLGVLVRENLINIRIVAHSSYGDVKYVWEKYEPVVKWLREYYSWPAARARKEQTRPVPVLTCPTLRRTERALSPPSIQ